jgi:cobalt-zinc-cadmium efflux system membrane fusion protein
MELFPMKSLFSSRATLVSMLTIAALVLSACGGESPQSPDKAAPKQAATKPGDKQADGKSTSEHGDDGGIKLTADEIKIAGIVIEPIEDKEVADHIVVTATILANQDRLARVSPRIAGRLAKVNANLGDKVAAGQTLATLDSIEMGEARSAYQQASSEAAVAKANFDRAEKLQGEQIISQKDFSRARADYEKGRAHLRAAADKLEMLGVPTTMAATASGLSIFPLTAPFAGTVIEKKAVVGELATPDKTLFTVADLSTLWIEANLFEKDLAQLKVGSDAVLTVNAYPAETFKGRLTYIGGVLDKETRTIRGRIEVRNADGRLKPEMFATAAIATGGAVKALTLPDGAMVLVSEQPTVFIQEGEHFEPRPIEVGEKLRGRMVVKSGLKPGERVVIAGAYALKARLLKSQIGDSH